MKIHQISCATLLAVATLGIAIAAQADTVTARCDVYPKGEDKATYSGLCTFSQRQGIVGIQLNNSQEKRYDLMPAGNQPNRYRDENGRPAKREFSDRGHIYRLATESIYVYWDTAPYDEQPNKDKTSNAQSAQMETTLISKGQNQLAMTIHEKDSEFHFSGLLTKSTGDTFTGEDKQVRVIYDRKTGRVTVINKVTGTELYNYSYRQ